MDELVQERSPSLAQVPSHNPWKYAFFGLVLLISTALFSFILGKKQATIPKQNKNTTLQEPITSLPTLAIPTDKPILNGSSLEDKGPAPSLDSITDWLNSSPVSINGKSILLVFCTPTLDGSFCSAIVPFLKQWDTKYKDKGLTIIWINTPYPVHKYDASTYRDVSISFMQKYSLSFPVGQDPTGILKDTYKITGWPDLIFIDRKGIKYQAQNVPTKGLANYAGYEELIIQLLDKK